MSPMDRRTFIGWLAAASVTPAVSLAGPVSLPLAPSIVAGGPLVTVASLIPAFARFPASRCAQLQYSEDGIVIAYDAMCAEGVMWDFDAAMPGPYAVDLLWRPAGATSGSVVWAVNGSAVRAEIVSKDRLRTRLTLAHRAAPLHVLRLADSAADTAVGDAHLIAGAVMAQG
jgi:hypothetical protein